MRPLKSQQLVLVHNAEKNALGLTCHPELMNGTDSNFRVNGFMRSCFGESRCQYFHEQTRKYELRGINVESIEVDTVPQSHISIPAETERPGHLQLIHSVIL